MRQYAFERARYLKPRKLARSGVAELGPDFLRTTTSSSIARITALHSLEIDTSELQPIPLNPPYFTGRFSDGRVLPEITADLLGASLDDFAFGGAQALGPQTFLDIAHYAAGEAAGGKQSDE